MLSQPQPALLGPGSGAGAGLHAAPFAPSPSVCCWRGQGIGMEVNFLPKWFFFSFLNTQTAFFLYDNER